MLYASFATMVPQTNTLFVWARNGREGLYLYNTSTWRSTDFSDPSFSPEPFVFISNEIQKKFAGGTFAVASSSDNSLVIAYAHEDAISPAVYRPISFVKISLMTGRLVETSMQIRIANRSYNLLDIQTINGAPHLLTITDPTSFDYDPSPTFEIRRFSSDFTFYTVVGSLRYPSPNLGTEIPNFPSIVVFSLFLEVSTDQNKVFIGHGSEGVVTIDISSVAFPTIVDYLDTDPNNTLNFQSGATFVCRRDLGSPIAYFNYATEAKEWTLNVVIPNLGGYNVSQIFIIEDFYDCVTTYMPTVGNSLLIFYYDRIEVYNIDSSPFNLRFLYPFRCASFQFHLLFECYW